MKASFNWIQKLLRVSYKTSIINQINFVDSEQSLNNRGLYRPQNHPSAPVFLWVDSNGNNPGSFRWNWNPFDGRMIISWGTSGAGGVDHASMLMQQGIKPSLADEWLRGYYVPKTATAGSRPFWNPYKSGSHNPQSLQPGEWDEPTKNLDFDVQFAASKLMGGLIKLYRPDFTWNYSIDNSWAKNVGLGR